MLDLTKIPFEPTNNYDKGRAGLKISHLIIHAMEGFYQGTTSWFKNPKSKVSAHYLISQEGQVVQMVADENRAWHCWGWNNRALGIELEDKKQSTSNPHWMTSIEYKTLVQLSAALVKKHSIPLANVIGHNNPAVQNSCPPRYKHYDPGPYFDFVQFHKDIQAELTK